MRSVIQRVKTAEVSVNGHVKSKIAVGLLILLGIEDADTIEDVNWLAGKISRLRIFDDNLGVMNLSVTDVEGEILVVSQFTLHASTKKGNRPSYIRASKSVIAIPLYEAFIKQIALESNRPVFSGEFGAMMQVGLINDGPVTIIIDSKNKE